MCAYSRQSTGEPELRLSAGLGRTENRAAIGGFLSVSSGPAHPRLRSLRCTHAMAADTLTTILLAAAILVLADLVLAGGTMTMTGMTAMAGLAAHPLAAVALIVLIVVLVLQVS